jgi:tetratricopeptide (TPR) repeat protein
VLKSKERASNSFFKREYDKALFHYSIALKAEPDDKDAKIGALLSDMASEREDEAVALFEFYEATKDSSDISAEDTIKQIIESVDQESDDFFTILDSLEAQISTIEDGVEYKDFLELVRSRDSFKNALQDLMFSSKIIIYKKVDFIDFINRLIEHDFNEMALNYIENAMLYYPEEVFFSEKLNQLENIEI